MSGDSQYSQYSDCDECGAKWFSACDWCAMERRRNALYEAYGIPVDPLVGRQTDA